MSITVLAAVSAINDAATIMTALTPLVQRAMANGDAEISDEDVAAARGTLTAGIEALDAAIEKARSA